MDLAAEIIAAEERTGEKVYHEQFDDLTVLFYYRNDGTKQVVATI